MAVSLALTFFSSSRVFSLRRCWLASSLPTNVFLCASFMRAAHDAYYRLPLLWWSQQLLRGASGLNHCACATLGKTPLQVLGFLPTSLLPTVAPITCNQLCRLRRCNIFGRLLLKNSSMWCGQHSWRYCSGVHAVSAHALLLVFPFSALHRLRCVFGKPIPRNNGHSLGFTHVHGN